MVARTGAVVGESESHQGSLAAMGDEYEDIVMETTAASFGPG